MTSQTWEGFTEVILGSSTSSSQTIRYCLIFIAFKIEKVISKIIQADQTDFAKNRQAADNVRRLFHIIETSKMRASLGDIIHGC